MSSLGGYLIVAGMVPALLGAQDRRMLRDRLERESVVATKMSDDLTSLRSIDRKYASVRDTIRIAGGNISVIAQPNIGAVARAAAGQADSILRQVDDLVPLIKGVIVYVELDTTSRFGGDEPHAIVRYAMGSSRNAGFYYAKVDATDIAQLIEGTSLNRIADRVRSPLVNWQRTNLPLRKEDVDRPIEWSNVRFDILESLSLLGPRCYRGDIVACSMQLGFTPVDDPVMAWYDSLTRVTTVQAYRERALRFNARATEACLGGNDRACGEALQSISTYRLPPSGPPSREAVLREAIRIGGDGAVERLLSSKGTPAEAIAAAARVPTDSVIKVWQREMREGSIGSRDLSFGVLAVAVGWILLLFVASTRISRWR